MGKVSENIIKFYNSGKTGKASELGTANAEIVCMAQLYCGHPVVNRILLITHNMRLEEP